MVNSKTFYSISLILCSSTSAQYHMCKVYRKRHNSWNKYINRILELEGSKISEKEVEKIIENKKYAYKIKNEIREVENSIISWIFIKKSFLFNEIHIKKLYHLLTKQLLQENGEKYPRGFKK